jgi:mannose-6-phosphate isomerase-like protein (cupin superfamily)
MSKYSKVNFSEVENSSQTDGNEMRFSRKHLDSTELGLTLMSYKPDFKSPTAHSHKEQEEVYLVTKGSGHILLDDEVQDLKVWDVVRVSPEVVRAFESGSDGLEIIAVGGQKPAGGDGIKHDAIWPA